MSFMLLLLKLWYRIFINTNIPKLLVMLVMFSLESIFCINVLEKFFKNFLKGVLSCRFSPLLTKREE